MDAKLLEAARDGDLPAAIAAIDAGADLHCRDDEKGYPPLVWATRNGHVEIVRLLIDRGADMDIEATYGGARAEEMATGEMRDGETINHRRPGPRFARIALGVATVLAFVVVFAWNNLRINPRSLIDEVKLHVATLRTAELSYYEEFGAYVDLGLNNEPRISGLTPRERLGWQPPSDLGCDYAVTSDASRVTIEVICDRDDGSSLAWGYVKSGPDGGPGLDGRLGRCQGNGVVDPRAGKPPLLDAVGSCREARAATH